MNAGLCLVRSLKPVSIESGCISRLIVVPITLTSLSVQPTHLRKRYGPTLRHGVLVDCVNDRGLSKRIGGRNGEAFDMFGTTLPWQQSFNTSWKRKIERGEMSKPTHRRETRCKSVHSPSLTRRVVITRIRLLTRFGSQAEGGFCQLRKTTHYVLFFE